MQMAHRTGLICLGMTVANAQIVYYQPATFSGACLVQRHLQAGSACRFNRDRVESLVFVVTYLLIFARYQHLIAFRQSNDGA